MESGTFTALVTGANRGIGLEFVRQLAARGWNVIATARDPGAATELNALAEKHPHLSVERLDVTDHAAVDAVAAAHTGKPIDLLLLNAGLTPSWPGSFAALDGLDFDAARRSFEVNALAPLKMCQAFMKHVVASRKKLIVALGSKAGSFAESPQMPIMYGYRASKAALGMYLYTLSFEARKKGVTVALISPGQVDTAAAPAAAPRPGAVKAEESVARMLTVIDRLGPDDSGKFFDYADGRVIGW